MEMYGNVGKLCLLEIWDLFFTFSDKPILKSIDSIHWWKSQEGHRPMDESGHVSFIIWS